MPTHKKAYAQWRKNGNEYSRYSIFFDDGTVKDISPSQFKRSEFPDETSQAYKEKVIFSLIKSKLSFGDMFDLNGKLRNANNRLETIIKFAEENGVRTPWDS